jgi:hypothetical protein
MRTFSPVIERARVEILSSVLAFVPGVGVAEGLGLGLGVTVGVGLIVGVGVMVGVGVGVGVANPAARNAIASSFTCGQYSNEWKMPGIVFA